MSTTPIVPRTAPLIALLLLLVATPAFAWVGVGAAPTCEARTLQAAVDTVMARQRAGDFDDPHIIIADGNFNEAVTIEGGGVAGTNGAILTITGGYAADCGGPQAGSVSTIDGAHRSGSVLTIHGKIAVTLDHLAITGSSTSGNGGGIDFDGAGSLDISNVNLRANHAGRGGGLYANGASPGLTIRLHQNTNIFGNSADHAGGGIRVQGTTRLFMLEGGIVSNNTVTDSDLDGAGGGIQVVGPAIADIGSSEVSFNTARIGGGISVDGSDGHNGTLRFYASRPGHPTRIENNRATQAGGGLFLGARTGFINDDNGVGCGFGFSISHNAAADGAAVYVSSDSFTGLDWGATAIFTSSMLNDTDDCGPEPATTVGALGCLAGTPCNEIDGNSAEDADGNATDGSILVARSEGFLNLDQVQVRANAGAHLWHGYSTINKQTCANCLFADNQISDDLFRMDDGGDLSILSSTITGNTIGGANVLSLSGDISVTESLLWQPGKTVLDQDSGHERTVRNVLANEIVSLGGGSTVVALYPQFVDPLRGDYHLAPNSPALDFAPSVSGKDLDGMLRTVELSIPNRPGGGPLDLGAYELQGIAVFPPDEQFDGVIAPALPPGWASAPVDASSPWITTLNGPSSAPNVAFANDTATASDTSLVSPAVSIATQGRLRFRHKMDIEAAGDFFASDGVVLEISIGGGAFDDILRGGGVFVDGAYDHSIFPGSPGDNPLKGRSVWSGTTAGVYKNVVVDLPSAADGQSIRLRWRVGTDNGNAAPHAGYFLDDIHIDVDGRRIFCNSFESSVACP